MIQLFTVRLSPVFVWLIVECVTPHHCYAADRIISLSPASTEIIATLNAASRLVGISNDSNYPESLSYLPKIGPFLKPNVAQIAALRPTLIVGIGQVKTSELRALEQRGVSVLLFDSPSSISQIYTIIQQIGRTLGQQNRATEVVKRLRRDVADIEGHQPKIKPTVFVVILHPPIMSVAANTFIGDMIRRSGGANAIDPGAIAFPKVSRETMLYKNPSIVLVTDPTAADAVRADAVFQVTAAGKNGHIVSSINPDLLIRPGPRFTEGMRLVQNEIRASVPR